MNYYDTDALYGMETTFNNTGLTGLFFGMMIFSLILSLILIISNAKVFKKAGKPWWAVLVPIYNTIVMIEIAKLPLWYIILFFVPIANVYAIFKINIEIAKKFGKSAGFGVGMTLLNIIFIPLLAFSDNKYEDGENTNLNNNSNNQFDATSIINNQVSNEVNVGESNFTPVTPFVPEESLELNNGIETVSSEIPVEPVVPQAPEVEIPVEPVVPQAPEVEIPAEPVVPQAPEVEIPAEPVVPQAPEVNAFNVMPENIVGNDNQSIQIETPTVETMPEVNAFNSVPDITNDVAQTESLVEPVVIEPETITPIMPVQDETIDNISESLTSSTLAENLAEPNKKCKNCGNELPEIVSICPNCGTDNE